MKSELLAKSPMLLLPLGALFLFVFIFVAVFFVTMRKGKSYEPVAVLPLDDGDDGEGVLR